MPRLLAEGVAITVAATVATAPLLAHHFGSVSVAGLVANLAGAAGGRADHVARHGVRGARAAAGAVPELGAVGRASRGDRRAADGVLLGYLAWLARVFAEAPGATVALPLGSPLAVVAAYAASRPRRMAIAPRRPPRRAARQPRWPAWHRAPARGAGRGARGGGALAALALVAWTGTPEPPRD